MGKTIAIVVLVVLLIGTNVWHFYSLIDQEVTMKYTGQELYELRKENDLLERLAERFVSGMPIEQFKAEMAIVAPNQEPFIKEGFINYLFLSGRLNANGDTIVALGDDGET